MRTFMETRNLFVAAALFAPSSAAAPVLAARTQRRGAGHQGRGPPPSQLRALEAFVARAAVRTKEVSARVDSLHATLGDPAAASRRTEHMELHEDIRALATLAAAGRAAPAATAGASGVAPRTTPAGVRRARAAATNAQVAPGRAGGGGATAEVTAGGAGGGSTGGAGAGGAVAGCDARRARPRRAPRWQRRARRCR